MVIKEVLPNGITLVTESMPHVRSVAIGVWIRQGSRHEREEESGIAHYIEHMVFKGTRTRPAEIIAAQVDSIGGHMDAFTAKEYAAFHLKVLDEQLPLATDILGDIVMNPLFDPDEMTKEKKVIFEEINMVEDTPDDLVMEMFSEVFWPSHPLGRPILGTKQSVESFGREELLSFFRAVYRPANMVISAAGHFEHKDIAALVGHHFGGLEAGGRRSPGTPPVARTGAVARRSKKELEQVHLCLGTPAYGQAHDDRFAVHVMNTVLGGSMSSRLFQNVREKHGLVYSISSGVSSYSDAGALTIYAGTSLDSVDRVVRLTVEELKRMKGEPVSAEEIRRAKDHLKGSLVLSLENTGSRMSHLARQEIHFGRGYGVDDIMAGIEAVSAEDVQRVAADLFSRDLSASILGNLGKYRVPVDLLRLSA